MLSSVEELEDKFYDELFKSKTKEQDIIDIISKTDLLLIYQYQSIK